MKKLLFLSAVLLFSIMLLYADNDKPIVTVLDFNVSHVSEQEAAILVDYISGHLVDSNKFRVIDRTQRQNILNELKFSYDGCADEKCQLEIGKQLAASYIFIGSLGKIGSRYILNISLVDVETGEAIKSESDKYDDLDALVDDTGRIVSLFTKSDDTGADPVNTPASTSPKTEAAPATVKPTSAPASSAPKSTKKIYFDFGAQIGGPLDDENTDGPCLGAWIGGLFPVIEFFYIGGILNVLFSIEDIDDGAAFLGGNLILGNPGSLALGIGAEFAGAHDLTGAIVLGGSLTGYIGGFDIRVFYGKDLAYDTKVLIIGCGGHL